MFKKKRRKMILGTSEERVRLLKKGIKSQTIENLYLRYNKIKIIKSPILFDLFENSSSNRADSKDTLAIELKHTDQIIDIDTISISGLVYAS
ncbi:hypothetical protein A2Z22_02030 [Candidatus Woesebacteria bacterium RBG_16_34_12]|uniref:Uncharacterized protein n=1 Tax=Candidatus Woesebacteria bacterium RBG_16_34_12 TaxID=1802480 RepID=A0A1F7X9H8_9BACT|nr:MAG: hypothetical protein A2Z22_02030 [Candidatus Woesebacteria bacterium RBG_16_34_12]